MIVSESSEVQGERWIVRNGEIRTDGPPYHCVASITITNNDVEHADARARLIAAAPDLMEALQRLLGAVDAHDDPKTLEELGAIGQACAAIAKATGETYDSTPV